MRILYNKVYRKLSQVYEQREAESMVQILFSEVTGLPKFRLFEEGRVLDSEMIVRIEEAEKLLLLEYPLQYILGETEFCGERFRVSEGVLIPRNETEELVSWIIADCEGRDKFSFLDIGTGTGCIALTLARHFPLAKGYGWDISPLALSVATSNRGTENVLFEQADILNNPTFLEQLDIIVSNPPYVCESEKTELRRNVLDYEPHVALFVPDDDPLLFYKAISTFATQYLADKGMLYFEINEQYGEEVVKLLVSLGFKGIEINEDIHHKKRMVKGQWRRLKPIKI